MTALPPLPDEQLDEVEGRLVAWARRQLDELEIVDAVEHEPADRRVFVRVRGEAKDVYTVWFTLRQRTLLYETYVAPAPEDEHARYYEYALRRNHELVGLAFTIGDEDALFLRGHLPADAVTDAELDRILGTVWTVVERTFRALLEIGFARLLRRSS